jgi:hypothetical protein
MSVELSLIAAQPQQHPPFPHYATLEQLWLRNTPAIELVVLKKQTSSPDDTPKIAILVSAKHKQSNKASKLALTP